MDQPLDIPDPEPGDPGVITSGSCATPEAQEWLDTHQVGKAPLPDGES